MNITIFGSDYMDLVTGACLADVGHQVSCIDTDSDKIAALRRGEVHIFEPGLERLSSGHLGFANDHGPSLDHLIYPYAGYGGSCIPRVCGRWPVSPGKPARMRTCRTRSRPSVAASSSGCSTSFRQRWAARCGAGPSPCGGSPFKPDTGDTRYAPNRVPMEAVWAAGGRTQAYYPQTMKKTGDRAYCVWEVDLSDAAP